MNLLPEVRDCIGYSHKHSRLIPSNRNSRFERLWRVKPRLSLLMILFSFLFLVLAFGERSS